MISLFASVVLAGACSDSGVAPPAAPTDLVVAPLGAGAHLTWVDNSEDELEFAVMRQQMGTDPAMREIATVPFNGVQFHDEPITSGATFVYQVIATNEGGDAASDQVTFVAP